MHLFLCYYLFREITIITTHHGEHIRCFGECKFMVSQILEGLPMDLAHMCHYNCLHAQAPQYLVELCQPVAGVASRQHLRSAAQRLLVVPRHHLSSYGRRAFCVAGPSVWNSLPDNLRNPIIGGNSFRQSLKTSLFATY